MQQSDFAIVLPEVLLALYAMGALMLAVYTTKDGMTRVITWATVGVFLALAAWIGLSGRPDGTAFGGAIAVDALIKMRKP